MTEPEAQADPYAHHPELRGRITDPDSSYFRDFSVERVLAENPEFEVFRDWAHTDAEREAFRSGVLAGHSGDLWVFAYGSLMWDPALRFAEVRRAHAPGHERRLVLKDTRGGRGSEEAPGLMAALHTGSGCDGLAYRIAAAAVDTETEILFRREMIGPGYLAAMVPLQIDTREVAALTFLADPASPDICLDIDRALQVRYIATGVGTLGTSRDYLAGIVDHFVHLGIDDPACSELLRAVDAWRAAHPDAVPA